MTAPDDLPPLLAELADLPEPPDGTRLEFETDRDVYAIWRNDNSSRVAGYRVGDGGDTWCIYGMTVPMTWEKVKRMFGHALLSAVRLVPHPDDIHKYAQWSGLQYDLTRPEGAPE